MPIRPYCHYFCHYVVTISVTTPTGSLSDSIGRRRGLLDHDDLALRSWLYRAGDRRGSACDGRDHLQVDRAFSRRRSKQPQRPPVDPKHTAEAGSPSAPPPPLTVPPSSRPAFHPIATGLSSSGSGAGVPAAGSVIFGIVWGKSTIVWVTSIIV
jgi:hypothetical protein